MRCLYCRQEIDSSSLDELQYLWHHKCCKKFFDVDVFPKIDISKQQLDEYVKHNIRIGLTITGVQKKLSLHLLRDVRSRLTMVGYPAGYVLKPQTQEYDSLPENENLVMSMANLCGIRTVEHALIRIDDEFAYITKRIDRIEKRELAMEDFCQLSGRLTEDKYKSSYERCGKLIRQYSFNVGVDLAEFFLRLVFCFLIGNSDMHLKNFSLIETSPCSRTFRLSPAYDLLSVHLALPDDKEQMALTLNAKKSNIRVQDFMQLAKNIGLLENASKKIIRSVVNKIPDMIALCHKSYLNEDLQQKLIDIIHTNQKKLSD